MIQAQLCTSHGQALSQHACTVELQRMAVVSGLSQTLLMPLFHKPDGGNGICFEQGLAEHGTEVPFA